METIGWMEKPVLFGLMLLKSVRFAIEPLIKSLLGNTSTLVASMPPDPLTMFPARKTPFELIPIVGKSAQWSAVELLLILKPVQPVVGSDEFETATRKLFGKAVLSTAAAKKRPLELS